MKDYTKQELKQIKAYCLHLSNDCGGCETCAQAFGPTNYDAQETYTLLMMIERRDRIIEKLKNRLWNAGEVD